MDDTMRLTWVMDDDEGLVLRKMPAIPTSDFITKAIRELADLVPWSLIDPSSPFLITAEVLRDKIVLMSSSGEILTSVLTAFDMIADEIALAKRLILELAFSRQVPVAFLDGHKLFTFNSFYDFVQLYVKSAPTASWVTTDLHSWGEVHVTSLDDEASQSQKLVIMENTPLFVDDDGMTPNIIQQLSTHLLSLIRSKRAKTAQGPIIDPQLILNRVWIFVYFKAHASVQDLKLSPQFLKQVSKSQIGKKALLLQLDADMRASDGSKVKRLNNPPRGLFDAKHAGSSSKSKECTLIFTEGETGKYLVENSLSGLPIRDQDRFGIFALNGKLINVKASTHDKIIQNKKIKNIKQILGLKQGDYDTSTLRYGSILIMTDQDHDGSHIKGLLLNIFHTFWPRLLLLEPPFFSMLITPLIKAVDMSEMRKPMTFFTIQDYEKWIISNPVGKWNTIFYKGLGDNDSTEGQEYFRNQKDLRKMLVPSSSKEIDDYAFNTFFADDMSEQRKELLKNPHKIDESYLHLGDPRMINISYSDFFHKEFIHYSIANNRRSIPAMVDGLKRTQRKVVFTALLLNLDKFKKVPDFAGDVSSKTAYHHGDEVLSECIILMAQDFVGSKNLNILQSKGQFGTRSRGPQKHCMARYGHTKISPIAKFVFPEIDNCLLERLKEGAQILEPKCYLPVIPLILVNGCNGLGTGWRSVIPCFNPREIIDRLRCLLNYEKEKRAKGVKETMEVKILCPWYRGFKGSILQSGTDGNGHRIYTSFGVVEVVNPTTFVIRELPVGLWTWNYKEDILEKMLGRGLIKGYSDRSKLDNVKLKVYLNEENRKSSDELIKDFKLTSTLFTHEMVLFDEKGMIKEFHTPEEILVQFFQVRLSYYGRRHEKLRNDYQRDLRLLDAKIRFVKAESEGRIHVKSVEKGRDALHEELRQEGYPCDDSTTGFDYLLTVSDHLSPSLTGKRIQDLSNEREQIRQHLMDLEATEPEDLWLCDLEALEKALPPGDSL